MRRFAGLLWLSGALVGCTSSTPAPASALAEAPPKRPAPPPPLSPSPGCGEPATRRGSLPTALVDAPVVLVDAVLSADEHVTFGERELAVERRAPVLWSSDEPPTPTPTLVLKRGDESRSARDFGAGSAQQLDGVRLQHRWSEDRERVWVHVTDNPCPPAHDQLDRPTADAPLWTWLSTRGLTTAAFGHGHSAKLSARLWQGDDGPRLSLDHNVLASRANLSGGVDLRPGEHVELTLGPAKIVVEEVILGETQAHLGGPLGVQPHPAVHARLRYERAEPPPVPDFPGGDVDPCGGPSPRFAEPRELLRVPAKVATHPLIAARPVTIEGVEFLLENEPLPEYPGGFAGLGLGVDTEREPGPRTRPIVHLQGDERRRIQQFPAELRLGDALVRVAREPRRRGEALRADVYRPACPASLVASTPATPTVLWLGTGGHRQVDLADARGGRASFELRDEQGGPPRVLISTRSPKHGARSLSFALDPESQPVAIDAGFAWLLGNWEVRISADPEDPGAPAWYAVAVPLLPK